MKLTDLINEEKYTIIDPKGNPAGTGTKMQANQRQKKLGGSKKGYFVVPAKKALKARRTLEKYKFDFKSTKLQDLMSDLYFESVNEGIEPQIKKIAYFTGTRPEAVEDFVSKHALNITKLLKYVEKGGLPQRMELVSALAGRPDNPKQKKIIKQFQESVNEEETFTATNKETGKTSVFKSKDARDAAVKAGTHADKDDSDGDTSKGEEKPNMFSKDTGYDAGGDSKPKKKTGLSGFIQKMRDKQKEKELADRRYPDFKKDAIIVSAIDKNGEKQEWMTKMSREEITNHMNQKVEDGEAKSYQLMRFNYYYRPVPIDESINEGYSTEEKRIVLMAVRKLAKYRNVSLDYAINDLLGAGQELERDIQKGKVK